MVEFCSCRCDASPVISASQRRQTPTLRCRIVVSDRHCSIDAAPKANIGTRRSSGYFESESVVIARQLRGDRDPLARLPHLSDFVVESVPPLLPRVGLISG